MRDTMNIKCNKYQITIKKNANDTLIAVIDCYKDDKFVDQKRTVNRTLIEKIIKLVSYNPENNKYMVDDLEIRYHDGCTIIFKDYNNIDKYREFYEISDESIKNTNYRSKSKDELLKEINNLEVNKNEKIFKKVSLKTKEFIVAASLGVVITSQLGPIKNSDDLDYSFKSENEIVKNSELFETSSIESIKLMEKESTDSPKLELTTLEEYLNGSKQETRNLFNSLVVRKEKPEIKLPTLDDFIQEDEVKVKENVIKRHPLVKTKEYEENFDFVSDEELNNTIKEAIDKHDLTHEQFDIICAVVQQEAGHNHEEVKNVMTTIINRMESGNWGGTNPWEVVTAEGQYAAYGEGHYKKYEDKRYDGETSYSVASMLNGDIKPTHNWESFNSNEVVDYGGTILTEDGNRYK